MPRSIEHQILKASGTTVSAAGMRLVKLLVGKPPQTIADLIKSVGVTRTAITEQLNELIAAGFVERDAERLEGRGRPRHLYSATSAALVLLFAGNQWMVVPAIWKALQEIGGEKLKTEVLQRVSIMLAEHYKERVRGKTPQQRLRQMARVLAEEEGNLVDIEKGADGQMLIRRRNCSFFSMFEESRAICRVDEEVLSEVVGAPVRRTSCRHDGDPCCAFEIVSSNGE